MPTTRVVTGGLLAAAVTSATLVFAGPALAKVPTTPTFTSAIESPAKSVAQSTCDPTEKPGVVDFRNVLNTTYGTHAYGIVRACDDGGTSEHKEGRALDYMLDRNNAAQKADAEDIVNWLVAADQWGHKFAMARRLGVMYIIWNHHIWSQERAAEGWRDYSCDGTASGCHENHVHFSFTWAGARKQTSWWTGRVDEPAPRIGVLTTAGVALAKEGGLSAKWATEHVGVKQVVVDGTRIGVLLTDGTALVKDGNLSAAWTTQHTGVKQLALDGDRIGVLLTDGTALVKDGNLSALWTTEYTNVAQLDLAGNRIGVLTTAGVALVKDGPLSALWTTEHTGVTQITLDGERIGVLLTDGNAMVKEKGLSALWAWEYSGVKQLVVAGSRIGVLTTAGNALVKEGGLSALWTTENTGVTQIALAGDRIGVLNTAGTALVKEGGLSALWTTENTGITQVVLS
jgi:hypothetical protein